MKIVNITAEQYTDIAELKEKYPNIYIDVINEECLKNEIEHFPPVAEMITKHARNNLMLKGIKNPKIYHNGFKEIYSGLCFSCDSIDLAEFNKAFPFKTKGWEELLKYTQADLLEFYFEFDLLSSFYWYLMAKLKTKQPISMECDTISSVKKEIVKASFFLCEKFYTELKSAWDEVTGEQEACRTLTETKAVIQVYDNKTYKIIR